VCRLALGKGEVSQRRLAPFAKSTYRFDMEWGVRLIAVVIAALGLGLLFRAQAIRNWLVKLYANPQITQHLQMPGYVLSMRLVGAGWFAFGIFILSAPLLPH
jgi:hypothetical protein